MVLLIEWLNPKAPFIRVKAGIEQLLPSSSTVRALAALVCSAVLFTKDIDCILGSNLFYKMYNTYKY